MLTHAARAAAKPPLVAARGAREGLWLEQIIMVFGNLTDDIRLPFQLSELREKRKLRAARGSGITATIGNKLGLRSDLGFTDFSKSCAQRE